MPAVRPGNKPRATPAPPPRGPGPPRLNARPGMPAAETDARTAAAPRGRSAVRARRRPLTSGARRLRRAQSCGCCFGLGGVLREDGDHAAAAAFAEVHRAGGAGVDRVVLAD